jgi:hypothetical protein
MCLIMESIAAILILLCLMRLHKRRGVYLICNILTTFEIRFKISVTSTTVLNWLHILTGLKQLVGLAVAI